jgi:hypothetical protein
VGLGDVNKILQLLLLLLLLAELLLLPLLAKLLPEPQQLHRQSLAWLLPQTLNLLFAVLSSSQI